MSGPSARHIFFLHSTEQFLQDSLNFIKRRLWQKCSSHDCWLPTFDDFLLKAGVSSSLGLFLA